MLKSLVALPALLCLLFSHPLTAQIPSFVTAPLDVNAKPNYQAGRGLEAFYPTSETSFFFQFGSTGAVPHFNGSSLDSIQLGDAWVRLHGRYAGGYLIHRSEGSVYSDRTYHVDTISLDTVALADGHLELRHVFPDGRRLLSTEHALYSIDRTPESLFELPRRLENSMGDFAGLDSLFVYLSYDGIYSTDGTGEGTVRLLEENYADLASHAKVNGRLYFLAEGTLYASDGTVGGTYAYTFDHLPVSDQPNSVYSPFATATGPVVYGRSKGGEGLYYYLDQATDSFRPLVKAATSSPFKDDSALIFRQHPSMGDDIMISDGSPEGTRVLISVDPQEVVQENWHVGPAAVLEDGTYHFTTNYGEAYLWWTVQRGKAPVATLYPEVLRLNTLTTITTHSAVFYSIRNGDESGVYHFDRAQNQFERLVDKPAGFGFMPLKEGGLVLHLSDDGYPRKFSTLIYYHGRMRVEEGYLGAFTQQNYGVDHRLPFIEKDGALLGISATAAVGEAIISYDLATGETEILRDLFPHSLSAKPKKLMAGERAAYWENEGKLYGSGKQGEFAYLFDGSFVEVCPVRGRNLSILLLRDANEWYVSDGTHEGTKAIAPPEFEPISNVISQSGDAFFLGRRSAGGGRQDFALIKLSISDATFSIIHLQQVYQQVLSFERPLTITSSDLNVFFPFVDDRAKWSIWKSDGTAANTRSAITLPIDDYRLHPFDLQGGNGIINYYVRLADAPLAGKRYFWHHDRAERTVEYFPAESVYYSNPVRIGNQVLYPEGGSIMAWSEGANESTVLMSCGTCFPAQLTAVNDNMIVYTAAAENYARSVWKLHSNGTSTMLVDKLRHNMPSDRPLPVWNEFLLAPRQSGGDHLTYEELTLIQVPTEERAVVTAPTRNHDIFDVITAGNRFFYISDDDIYGEEVFALFFPEYPTLESGIVGITKAITQQLSVDVWPNPTTSAVTIELPAMGLYACTVVDALGKVIAITSLRQGSNLLDLTGYSAGVYFVRISDKQNSAAVTKRVVVR